MKENISLHTIFEYKYEGSSIGFHGDTFGTKVAKKDAKRYSPRTIEDIAEQLETIRENAIYGMTNKESLSNFNWKDYSDPELLEIIPQQVAPVAIYYKFHRVEPDGTFTEL